jgi:N-acyl homoserine lactone hydrolase
MMRLASLLPIAALAASAGMLQAKAPGELRLYVFDCGSVRVESVEMFGIGDHETEIREAAAPCYMVEHPRGRLLWDGGVASAFALLDGWQDVGGGFSVRLDRTLADQLAELSLDMASFDYVAFSHLHDDHVGVANDLRGGTLLIQRAEYELAFADEVTGIGYTPQLYEGLRSLDRLIIEGDHDVFGDGRVRLISAPGHTPGHQVLWVDLAATGPVLLSGDLYHFVISREQQRVPLFEVDAEQTLESRRRVEALVKQTGAVLWIQHDLALFQTQTKAPAYYR